MTKDKKDEPNRRSKRGILYEEWKRGEYNPKPYVGKGLPDIGTDPIPLWSYFAYINGKYDEDKD